MYVCLNRATAGGAVPFEQFLDIAASAGFAGADLDPGHALMVGAAAVADQYGQRRLRLGGWGLPFDWRGDEAKQAEGLEMLASVARMAADLKIDSCATWIMPSSDLPFMDNWNFHVSRLRPAAQRLAEHGLRLGLEFIGPYHLRRKHPHEFIFTMGQMLELADAVGPNAGLLVDVFHVHTSGGTLEHLSQVPGQRIVLAHLNDAPDVPVASQQDGHRLLPGEGMLNLNGFMDALRSTGYAGPVALEVFSADLRAMPPAEAALRAWQATRKALPGYV
jgi:sugar phosphate isomerase/epimerase